MKNTLTKCHRLWDKILQWDSLSHRDKQSKFTRSECYNLGWMYNPSHFGTEQILTADSLSGGHFVWVEMSHGQFVGGRIVKAPKFCIIKTRVDLPTDVQYILYNCTLLFFQQHRRLFDFLLRHFTSWCIETGNIVIFFDQSKCWITCWSSFYFNNC